MAMILFLIPGQESFLKQFFDATASMDPTSRGAFLENPPQGAPNIEETHHVSGFSCDKLTVTSLWCWKMTALLAKACAVYCSSIL